MGGAFDVPGNVSPVAEANISGDRDAADIVVTAPWKVTMVALNTTTKVKLTDEILQRIRQRNDRYGPFIWSITRFYMDFHKNVNHVEGGFYVHDPSAVMFLIDPSLFTTRTGPVRVATDGIAMGETIMPAYDYQLDLPPWHGRPAVTTATDVNVDRFPNIRIRGDGSVAELKFERSSPPPRIEATGQATHNSGDSATIPPSIRCAATIPCRYGRGGKCALRV